MVVSSIIPLTFNLRMALNSAQTQGEANYAPFHTYISYYSTVMMMNILIKVFWECTVTNSVQIHCRDFEASTVPRAEAVAGGVK